MSNTEFYTDKAGEHRWHITIDDDGDDGAIHACHEGFSSKYNAVQNLFINHAMMSIFVGSVARGDQEVGAEAAGIFFEEDADEKVRWKIKGANGELTGASHKGFEDTYEAMSNLVITYTMLTVFVAEAAPSRAGELE